MTLNDIYEEPDGEPIRFCDGCDKEMPHFKTFDEVFDSALTMMVFACTKCGCDKTIFLKTSAIKRK
jgi:hypothetical protein